VEEIIGTLHEVSGFTFDTLYDLIFTSERVVVVLILSPNDVVPSETWRALLITGWLSKRNEQQQQQKIIRERHHQSQTLTLNELVLKNSNNFEIRYSDITSIEIKHRLFQYQLCFNFKGISKNKPQRKFIIQKIQIPDLKIMLSRIATNTVLKNKDFIYVIDEISSDT
jgi:hypothetical protein